MIARPLRMVRSAALGTLLVLPLTGCGYDYLQNTDRVGYGAGDAVKANLESETTNPFKRSMYDTKGLGQNGQPGAGATTAAASGAVPAASSSSSTPAATAN